LVSGLDTATIISQLLQLEARPQTMLKSRVSTAERQVTALQTLNAKLAGIATKAAELANTGAWSPLAATSTSDKISVTPEDGALPMSFSVAVQSTAKAYSATYGSAVAKGQAVTTSDTLTIDVDGAAASINLTDKTLEGVAKAINAADQGVQAVLVRAGGTAEAPTYRLNLTATSSGMNSAFTVDDGTGVAGTFGGIVGEVDASDATILVNGASVTSPTNTFEGLMPGVTLTVAPDATTETTGTVTVARDAESVTESVKALVDAVNGALTEVASLTAHAVDGKGGGLLAGDSTLRGVRNQLLSLVTGGVDDVSLAPYGIQTDRYGKLVFDEVKFEEAFKADPTKTTEMFTVPSEYDWDDPDPVQVAGFAGRLERLADTFSDSLDGTVTLSIKGRQSQIKGWEDDVADWDVRLAAREATLQRQYTALETALGQLQSQGNWLAGQLGSLPKMSSGQ
jgi:flagellar hook-associated protein 2